MKTKNIDRNTHKFKQNIPDKKQEVNVVYSKDQPVGYIQQIQAHMKIFLILPSSEYVLKKCFDLPHLAIPMFLSLSCTQNSYSYKQIQHTDPTQLTAY